MQRLTSDQKVFFDTFGHLKFDGLFADRAEQISDEFECIWTDRGGLGHDGKPHTGAQRSSIGACMDKSELLSSLLDDSVVEGALATLLGDDLNYVGTECHLYVGHSPWHKDNDSSVHYLRVAIYPDRRPARAAGYASAR